MLNLEFPWFIAECFRKLTSVIIKPQLRIKQLNAMQYAPNFSENNHKKFRSILNENLRIRELFCEMNSVATIYTTNEKQKNFVFPFRSCVLRCNKLSIPSLASRLDKNFTLRWTSWKHHVWAVNLFR